jgi:outer membrane autotransporter protein
VQTTIVDDSRYIRQAVLGRLRQAPYANGTGAMAALGTGGPMLAYADSFAAADSVLGYADTKKPAFPIKAPPLAAPAQTPDLTFWAQGVGAWGKINSDGNAADVGRNLAGFFTGFDRRFGEWRLGAAAGYTNSSLSMSARASSANIDTAYLAAYAGTASARGISARARPSPGTRSAPAVRSSSPASPSRRARAMTQAKARCSASLATA